MRTSIVIPVYNQAIFLPEAIESALAQTVKAEIIVVNDGSTDNSLDIAKGYPVKVINQVNKGLASARNTGIMNMAGDYFLPLDADDILLENCVEKIEEAIEEHHADVVAPSFKSFGTHNGQTILTGIPGLKDFTTANRLPYFSAIKKEVLLEVGGYSPRMIWGYEDYALWMDIFRRGKSLCVLQDVLVLYRTKENSMIHDANAHAEELWAQMHKDYPELWS
jgi:glycosyltransferase involved in cell wall biosynthesis